MVTDILSLSVPSMSVFLLESFDVYFCTLPHLDVVILVFMLPGYNCLKLLTKREFLLLIFVRMFKKKRILLESKGGKKKYFAPNFFAFKDRNPLQ